jgi:hypothetical protein
MTEHYYTVGIHGAPTPETAPHGYRWRVRSGSYPNTWYLSLPSTVLSNSNAEWAPLPAPPTEQAPPPVPVARWAYCRDYDNVSALRLSAHPPITDHHEAARYRDALNTLDANGVAWGPGRPMSELPDDGLVLVQMPSGVPYTLYIRKADYIATHRNTYDCWWPLPGEAQ